MLIQITNQDDERHTYNKTLYLSIINCFEELICDDQQWLVILILLIA